MRKLFMILLAVLFTASVFAQSPEKMSYQAVIRNSSGNLVISAPIKMRVSIMQGSATGSIVYLETKTTTTNANGLVTVEIGDGPEFKNINWSAGPYFIKIETDPSGGTNFSIISANQLLSVPYALYAKTAGNSFSGNYLDLTNKPLLFDGNYNTLTNKPILFDGTWTSLSGKPTLFSGDYNLLTNKPVLFDGNFASLTNKPTTALGYGLTDVMTTSHLANSITQENLTKWNTAYAWSEQAYTWSEAMIGWGNHNVAGYLKSTTTGINSNFMKVDLINTVNNSVLVYSTTAGQWGTKPITDFTSIFAPVSHTHVDATTSASGFMSIADKTKLNAVDGSETKVNASSGIVVKGNGTTATPYAISVAQHVVGETYGGGVVFYVYDNGQHGLIASTADATIGGNPNLYWIWNAQPFTAGAGASGIRGGIANTAAIMAYQMRYTYSYPLMSTYSIAVAVSMYSATDALGVRYADWYVPSSAELILLLAQSGAVPNLNMGSPYWSSTEALDNPNYANAIYGGAITVQPKSSPFRVRAIRAF
jgi:hypothetical protein